MGGGGTGTRVRGRTEKVPSRSIDSSGRTRRRRIRRRSGARRRRGGPRGERDDAPRICRAPETRETEDLGPCVCASRSPASFFGGDRRARILCRDALPVGYLTTRRALGSPRRDGKTASDCDEQLRKIYTLSGTKIQKGTYRYRKELSTFFCCALRASQSGLSGQSEARKKRGGAHSDPHGGEPHRVSGSRLALTECDARSAPPK